MLSICGKSTVHTKIIKFLTDWTSKEPSKNESDYNKEVMEKHVELLALSNIIYVSFPLPELVLLCKKYLISDKETTN